MLTIKDSWSCFEKAVMPADASDVQRQEMRRSFYAGARALLTITIAIGDDGVSEDQGCAVLSRLQAELDEFSRKVRTGQA